MANKKKIKIKDKRVRSILRGPLFWIVVALVTVVIFGRISNTGQMDRCLYIDDLVRYRAE